MLRILCLIYLIFDTYHLFSLGVRLKSRSNYDDIVKYYSLDHCKQKGLLPTWHAPDYTPKTNFEKLFRTPLALDLLASAHSGNETGFEQVTADWGCDYKPCYGTGALPGSNCESVGFYGPGAKDPAGGGCPRGPVRVYEDLACAILLGYKHNTNVFQDFCDITKDEREGMYECLAFFANVLTETGSFAETEERDPRPYCWDRSDGNTNCCPSPNHRPCLPDSDKILDKSEYPENELWLGNSHEPGKCCSYHGRGFLQVSYEPNYKALSQDLFLDETLLWHYPYLLDSDGVMGWTAALWFWFNSHPAQVSSSTGEEQVISVSPRSEVLNWKGGHGLPGAVNVINGMECANAQGTIKALSRVSYFFAIAHRLGAKPPIGIEEEDLSYYPLPGTSECESHSFCRNQFHNNKSPCPLFNGHLDCTSMPYMVNASTPMGFWRRTIKMTQIDGSTPICKIGNSKSQTPAAWKKLQEPFEPIDQWWDLLDITTENVCDYTKLMYSDNPGDSQIQFKEGESKYCTTMCWKDFAFDLTLRGQACEEPQQPCKTLAEWMSHPLPRKNWKTGEMGDYKGGAYLGRVGPGLIMAMNGPYGFGDRLDRLCFHFGESACHWNIGMGCQRRTSADTHFCRVYPPKLPETDIIDSLRKTSSTSNGEILAPGEWPYALRWALDYYNEANCPKPTGKTILEQLFPDGPLDMDFIFSVHYSQNDGFANGRWDNDDPSVNENTILKGSRGPQLAWKAMLCAFQLGIPTDRDIFQKKFGLRAGVSSAAEIPYPLSAEQKKFAKLEFISLAANIIKETGAMGQAEEQDPRCYCNNQGGSENPCCPNEWGNNPPCYTETNSENTIISPEEMKRGTTIFAKCCSYHGRGFLQTSYEKNYGDLGAVMLLDPSKNIDKDLGRKLLINYPQAIDSFGITGWTATFLFWLHAHPCQFCEGKQSNTLDWNAKSYSPHDAIVDFDKPGEGLGKTFTIINGQECEAFMSSDQVPLLGGQMRLALFYNLAHRLNVIAPGENNILPLPGTKECDASPWCKGTFYETDSSASNYRDHAGGCWVLTPQPIGNGQERWVYCDGGRYIPGTTKLGASVSILSFTLRKPSPERCEILHDFSCLQKTFPQIGKPSMYSDQTYANYIKTATRPADYTNPDFLKLLGLTIPQLCEFVVDTNLNNNMPPANQNCNFWCNNPSGAGRCTAVDQVTCRVSDTGANFIKCAHAFFDELTPIASDCRIKLPDNLDPNNIPPATTTVKPPGVCELCTECKGVEALNNQACSKCALNPSMNNNWPCNNSSLCVCSGTQIAPTAPPPSCDELCSSCISKSGTPEDDQNCKKCAYGKYPFDWPCSNSSSSMCKCAPGAGGNVVTTKPPTATTIKTPCTTTRFVATTGNGNTIATTVTAATTATTIRTTITTAAPTTAATTTAATTTQKTTAATTATTATQKTTETSTESAFPSPTIPFPSPTIPSPSSPGATITTSSVEETTDEEGCVVEAVPQAIKEHV